MILTQTTALLVDAYRELNAKKLFWVTMALSCVVVLVMACLGIDQNGVTFFTLTLDFIPITSDLISREVFYKQLFSGLGISVWLTWAAAILALISTAGIIPDLVSGGSIETVLSKPVSRARLFLTKYVMGLLFVSVQVLAFSLGSFLVFGLRAGMWEPGIFLAVPIVLVFFSYLFGVCALVGLLTRSTITALLVTLLFWFVLWLVNTGDVILLQFRTMEELQLQKEQERLDLMKANTSKVLIAQRKRENTYEEGWTPTEDELRAANMFIDKNADRIAELQAEPSGVAFWSDLIVGVKTVLPKTAETIGLLERHLIDLSDLPDPEQDTVGFELNAEEIDVSQDEAARAINERLRERSVAWILATSLAFEAVVLAIATVIFARRDF